MRALPLVLVLAAAGAAAAVACGGSDSDGDNASSSGGTSDAGPRGLEQAGQACTAATQCYAGLDGGALTGQATCLERVPNGYCTHTCTKDEDCCATPGECRTGVKEVCSPFTNEKSVNYCFLSCEGEDIDRAIASNAAAGYYDGGSPDSGSREDAYCQSYASINATCRSSGGGSKNRKVCIPKE